MRRIEIYTKDWCRHCVSAKALLRNKGFAYEEIDVTDDAEQEEVMQTRSARRSVPQIFVDGVHLGGFDKLVALDSVAGSTRHLDGISNGVGVHSNDACQ